MVSLPDVEFKKGWINEVGGRGKEAEFEAKLEPFGHIDPCLSQARHVGRESHHCVEREKQCIQQKSCYVIEPLIVQESEAAILITVWTIVTGAIALSVRTSVGPGGVWWAFRLVLAERLPVSAARHVGAVQVALVTAIGLVVRIRLVTSLGSFVSVALSSHLFALIKVVAD